MSTEGPKKYSEEERAKIAELEKSRTISDAGLLEGGAEYVVGDSGEKDNLLPTEEQKRTTHDVMMKSPEMRSQIDKIARTIDALNLKKGDWVCLNLHQNWFPKNWRDVLSFEGKDSQVRFAGLSGGKLYFFRSDNRFDGFQSSVFQEKGNDFHSVPLERIKSIKRV